MDHWCRREGIGRGAVVPTEGFWPLARVWYEGRLDPEWAPRSSAEATALLERCGLTDPFWAAGP